MINWGFPRSSVGKESACKAGDLGLIPELGRSPGEGNGNPLQYTCWRIPWTEEPGRHKSQTRPTDQTTTRWYTGTVKRVCTHSVLPVSSLPRGMGFSVSPAPRGCRNPGQHFCSASGLHALEHQCPGSRSGHILVALVTHQCLQTGVFGNLSGS